MSQLYRQDIKLHCFPAAFHSVLCTSGRRTEQHWNITSKVIEHLQMASVHNNLTIFLHCHSKSTWTNQERRLNKFSFIARCPCSLHWSSFYGQAGWQYLVRAVLKWKSCVGGSEQKCYGGLIVKFCSQGQF